MRTRLTLTSLLFLCLHLQAAQNPAASEFPFEYREGMIWLKVQSPRSDEPLSFLLDSGAGVSVLNLSTAQRLGLRLANRVEVQGVGSTTTGFFPQRFTASVAEVPMPKQYAAVDLDKLSDACHCQVDGLIGADFFRDRIVQIDFQSQKIRLLKSRTLAPDSQVLPLKRNRNALLAPISVNGQENQWLRVDTGCASALQWVTRAIPTQIRSHRVAIALKEISVDTTPVTVTIAKIQFPSVPADLHEHPTFSGEDGLLGNGILSRFRSVTLDTITGQISFESSNSR